MFKYCQYYQSAIKFFICSCLAINCCIACAFCSPSIFLRWLGSERSIVSPFPTPISMFIGIDGAIILLFAARRGFFTVMTNSPGSYWSIGDPFCDLKNVANDQGKKNEWIWLRRWWREHVRTKHKYCSKIITTSFPINTWCTHWTMSRSPLRAVRAIVIGGRPAQNLPTAGVFKLNIPAAETVVENCCCCCIPMTRLRFFPLDVPPSSSSSAPPLFSATADVAANCLRIISTTSQPNFSLNSFTVIFLTSLLRVHSPFTKVVFCDLMSWSLISMRSASSSRSFWRRCWQMARQELRLSHWMFWSALRMSPPLCWAAAIVDDAANDVMVVLHEKFSLRWKHHRRVRFFFRMNRSMEMPSARCDFPPWMRQPEIFLEQPPRLSISIHPKKKSKRSLRSSSIVKR